MPHSPTHAAALWQRSLGFSRSGHRHPSGRLCSPSPWICLSTVPYAATPCRRHLAIPASSPSCPSSPSPPLHPPAVPTSRLRSLRASFYRGGTSKGLLFALQDLPEDRSAWDSIFRAAMGSPDPNARQLDGLGGGYSSVSKVCVVNLDKPSRKDVDVEFTFVQVGIKDDMVDYASNCGNMSSAVGPYAVECGLPCQLDESGKVARVRILNTNTNKVIHATFPVLSTPDSAGASITPDYYGSFAIDGVPGTAARIQLSFINPGGSKTGKLLPTGNPTDVMSRVPGLQSGKVEASLVDCGNPCVYVRAQDLVLSDGKAVDGTISPDDISAHPSLLSTLEEVRVQGSLMMGLTTSRAAAAAQRSIPKVCLVSPASPTPHKLLSGGMLADPSSYDVLTRTISTGDPHRAIPITVSLCVAAASKIRGSVVETCLKRDGRPADEQGIVIAHPSGKITVGADVTESKDGQVEVQAATIYRTARKLFEGKVFYREEAQCAGDTQ